jgi:hypothetical protein
MCGLSRWALTLVTHASCDNPAVNRPRTEFPVAPVVSFRERGCPQIIHGPLQPARHAHFIILRIMIVGRQPQTKIVQGWPKLWANVVRALVGIFSQNVGPGLAIWANSAQSSFAHFTHDVGRQPHLSSYVNYMGQRVCKSGASMPFLTVAGPKKAARRAAD